MALLQIALQRLLNQQIAEPAAFSPAAVVARLGAVQAQDYLGALWAVGLRMKDATEQSVEQGLADKQIVRTWPMRGTIHFVAAADVRWMLELLAPRVVQRTTSRRNQLGLDEPTITASAAIIVKALEGGRQLTRSALYQELEHAQIATTGSRGLHILGRLAHDRLICFGAREAKQPTFALLDEWVPEAPSLPRDEALATLTLRYFTGHGPATVRDFMWWSGLNTAEVKAGLAAAGSRLASERVEGQEYFWAADQPAAEVRPADTFLLPPFDEFLVGYRDRSAVLDPQHNNLIVPGGNGIFNPIVVIGGRVVGSWKRVLKRDTVVLTFQPFTGFSTEEIYAITASAQLYGQFVGKHALVEL